MRELRSGAYLCWNAVSLSKRTCSSKTLSHNVNIADGKVACTIFLSAIFQHENTKASLSRTARGTHLILLQATASPFLASQRY